MLALSPRPPRHAALDRRRGAPLVHRGPHGRPRGGLFAGSPGAIQRGGETSMTWIAWKMLTGDRSKYVGIVFGVTFATLLMSQQISIFAGIMKRTASQILDVRDADVWVMDNKVRYVDEVP